LMFCIVDLSPQKRGNCHPERLLRRPKDLSVSTSARPWDETCKPANLQT
jgi:hypothetical protein